MKNQLLYYLFNFLLLIFFLNITNLDAQKTVPEWQWAVKAGGYNNATGVSITVDNKGNTYFTGYFSGTTSFGNIELTSVGEEDIFVAKLNSEAKWEWAVKAGGRSSEKGQGITIDSSGNIYITGWFFSTSINFGNIKLIGNAGTEIFIAKIDNNGQWQWAVSPKGMGYDQANSIAIDLVGDIYITGYFEGKIIFGDTTLFSTLHSTYWSRDIFIAKINSKGQWQWVVNAGGDGLNEGNSIAVDSIGNAYITGNYAVSKSTDTVYFGKIKLNASGWSNIFVAKVNSTGSWQWAVNAGSNNDSNGEDCFSISVDVFGNSFITGVISDTSIFGNFILPVPKGFAHIFVAKLDNNGNWKWVTDVGNKGSQSGNSIIADKNGSAYITGAYVGEALFGTTSLISSINQSTVFVAKIDSSGLWQWAIDAKAEVSNGGSSIGQDLSGNKYVLGTYNSPIRFGSTSLPSIGAPFIFIAKLNEEEIVKTVNELKEEKGNIKLYPNPATNILTIETLKSINSPIIITDITGRQVMQVKNLNENTINLDISSLSKGLYFISLDQTTNKFIKE